MFYPPDSCHLPFANLSYINQLGPRSPSLATDYLYASQGYQVRQIEISFCHQCSFWHVRKKKLAVLSTQHPPCFDLFGNNSASDQITFCGWGGGESLLLREKGEAHKEQAHGCTCAQAQAMGSCHLKSFITVCLNNVLCSSSHQLLVRAEIWEWRGISGSFSPVPKGLIKAKCRVQS